MTSQYVVTDRLLSSYQTLYGDNLVPTQCLPYVKYSNLVGCLIKQRQLHLIHDVGFNVNLAYHGVLDMTRLPRRVVSSDPEWKPNIFLGRVQDQAFLIADGQHVNITHLEKLVPHNYKSPQGYNRDGLVVGGWSFGHVSSLRLVTALTLTVPNTHASVECDLIRNSQGCWFSPAVRDGYAYAVYNASQGNVKTYHIHKLRGYTRGGFLLHTDREFLKFAGTYVSDTYCRVPIGVNSVQHCFDMQKFGHILNKPIIPKGKAYAAI